mgnify:CR=1 FL=1
MDIKKLIEDLHGLLKQYGEKIPYGELVGAPCPYSRTGDLVWQDPELYLIEQAANAITDLLVENQSLRNAANDFKARCETLEKMVREYQDVIVPGCRERAEKAERALAHMWYAYENKDGEFPHEYEKESVAQAEKILGKWEDVMPNMMKEE